MAVVAREGPRWRQKRLESMDRQDRLTVYVETSILSYLASAPRLLTLDEIVDVIALEPSVIEPWRG